MFNLTATKALASYFFQLTSLLKQDLSENIAVRKSTFVNRGRTARNRDFFNSTINEAPVPDLFQLATFLKRHAPQHFAAMKNIISQYSQRRWKCDTFYVGVIEDAAMLVVIVAGPLKSFQTLVQNDRAQLLVLLEHPSSGHFDRTRKCDLLDVASCFCNRRDTSVVLRLRNEGLYSLPHVFLILLVDDTIHEYSFAICINETIPI